ncbi:uncharacterized protein FIBRA_05608 [Fibroporia radiculosa]|uniref:Uncharacterized protein n=1 Tax=Fibroporia radiculosa TaxID=599839 RepID=J4GRB6_9APHY|nr:uncharacterized protein FIBRA_05608 [Fibroporia radiculosa]CCM03475.1 predicted protein [Fibroporia radiculosa]
MSSGAAYNIWGAVTGAAGLAATLPMVFTAIHNQLPSAKMKVLDEILSETRSLLTSVAEEGLFSDVTFVASIEHRLSNLQCRAERYREETYCATTLTKQFKEMLTGLSRRISFLCKEVKKIRAVVVTTTARERERLCRETTTQESTSSASSVPPFEIAINTNRLDDQSCNDVSSGMYELMGRCCGAPPTATLAAVLPSASSLPNLTFESHPTDHLSTESISASNGNMNEEVQYASDPSLTSLFPAAGQQHFFTYNRAARRGSRRAPRSIGHNLAQRHRKLHGVPCPLKPSRSGRTSKVRAATRPYIHRHKDTAGSKTLLRDYEHWGQRDASDDDEWADDDPNTDDLGGAVSLRAPSLALSTL